MSKDYSIAESRKFLPSLVRRVEERSPVRLTRRGKPVAVLMSVADYARLSGKVRNPWAAIRAFREQDDFVPDLDEVYRGVRDRSAGRWDPHP